MSDIIIPSGTAPALEALGLCLSKELGAGEKELAEFLRLYSVSRSPWDAVNLTAYTVACGIGSAWARNVLGGDVGRGRFFEAVDVIYAQANSIRANTSDGSKLLRSLKNMRYKGHNEEAS